MSTAHRREIDGLRAVAVMAVLLFHAGLGWVAGGFIGVDAFFVLSGYLITGLLLDEARTGRIDLVRFYARRSRRLLPAALLVVVATSVAWLLTSSIIDRQAIVGDARAATLYVANWHFARQATDYFAMDGAESPFLHFWSLAAEEQFYLAWPAIIVAVVAVARRRERLDRLPAGLRALAAVLGAASLVSLAATTATGDDALAYFGTHHRVYQLMAGAVLATIDWGTVGVALRRLGGAVAATALAALIVVSLGFVDLGPGTRGLAAAATTTALLAGLTVSGSGSAATRLLSTAPMVRLGVLSYGIYLWHWPVILLLQRFVTSQAVAVAVLAAAISTALAWLSHDLVERPVRFSGRLNRHHRAVIASGLAISAVVGMAIAPSLLGTQARPRFVSAEDIDPRGVDSSPVAALEGDPASSPVDEPVVGESMPGIEQVLAASFKDTPPECVDAVESVCLVHRGSAATVLFIGDSHLLSFTTELAQVAAERDVTMWLSLQALCPWLHDVVEGGRLRQGCADAHRAIYERLLATLRPDAVVVLNRAYDDPLKPTRFIGPDGELAPAGDVLVEELPRAVDRLLESTSRLVVVEPWPSLSIDQRVCLTLASTVAECRAIAADRPLASDAVVARIAASDRRVVVVSITDLICPRFPVCDAVVSGEVVRADHNHLNHAFATVIFEEFLRRLTAAGAFGTAR